MLRNDLLFVVGAALSAEMSLPLGGNLKSTIRRNLPDARGDGGDRMIRGLLESQANPVEWFRAAAAIKSALPYAASIDNLVEHHQDDANIVSLAKWSIARAIAAAESKSYVQAGWNRHPDRPNELATIAGGWQPATSYHELFRLIVQGVPKAKLAEAFSRLRVLTFNYDNTLEAFLFKALRSHSQLAPEEAWSVLDHATFIHAYGKLNRPRTSEGYDLSELESCYAIPTLASNLRTFSEASEGTHDDTIKALVRDAGTIVFLGCAYHRQNLELMRPKLGFSAYAVYGTVYVPAPHDPGNNAHPQFDQFSAPLRNALKGQMYGWSRSGGAQRLDKDACFFEPMTCQQLLARYGVDLCE